MELSKYIGKKIRIDLTNGFYYEGIVLSADADSIEIKDRKGMSVQIKEVSISFLREVGE